MASVLTQEQAQRLAQPGRAYRSSVMVTATRLSEARQWVSDGRSELRGAAGDWLLSDGSGEWTITDEAFRATYEQLADGLWSKPEPVHAIQLADAVDVQTPEGVSRGEAGDWLLTGAGAGAWPVNAQVFSERYVAAT